MHQPTRTCIICRIKMPKAGFLALTRVSGNILVVNQDQMMDGRSAYVCKTKKCGGGLIERFGDSKSIPGIKLKLDREQLKVLTEMFSNLTL